MSNLFEQPEATLEPGLTQRVKALGLKSQRGWPEFVGGKEKYTVPSPKDVPTRVKENLLYFQTNYIILFLILCIYCVITSPLFLISFLLIVGLWVYFMVVRTTPITIGSRVVTDQQRTIGLSIGMRENLGIWDKFGEEGPSPITIGYRSTKDNLVKFLSMRKDLASLLPNC
eukprot:Phypoly_transcript_21968.p1 GENE.Phypoly_transcript_21968~~Phypoly_transcript_21968.p1  ORF type:complete len:194 (+),score=14.75 Phypoly_transcript_21968:70-582(+)